MVFGWVLNKSYIRVLVFINLSFSLSFWFLVGGVCGGCLLFFALMFGSLIILFIFEARKLFNSKFKTMTTPKKTIKTFIELATTSRDEAIQRGDRKMKFYYQGKIDAYTVILNA